MPSDGSLRQAVSRGAAATLILRGTAMALAGVAAIVLARELGSSGYGIYSWAFAWVAALAVPAALGADELLVRQTGVAVDRGEWDQLRALVRSTFGRVLLVSLGLAIAGATALVLAGGSDARRSALLVALPILPLGALAALAQGALLGFGRTATAVAPGTLGRQALFLALVVTASAAGGVSTSGAVALQLTTTAAASVALLLLLRRVLAAGPRTAAVPAVRPSEWLRTSIPMGAAAMFLVVDAQVGLLVLGAVGSAHDAGVYAAALQCTAPFVLVLAAGRLPLGSVVARLRAAGERERLQRGLRTATRAVAGLSAAAAAVLIAVPGSVLGLFGDDFSRGEATLRLIAVAWLINALCAFNGLVLIMGGEERAAMRAALACLALDAALCLALVPPLGARGAAIAVLVSVTARNIANSVTTRRRLGIDTTVLGRP